MYILYFQRKHLEAPIFKKLHNECCELRRPSQRPIGSFRKVKKTIGGKLEYINILSQGSSLYVQRISEVKSSIIGILTI